MYFSKMVGKKFSWAPFFLCWLLYLVVISNSQKMICVFYNGREPFFGPLQPRRSNVVSEWAFSFTSCLRLIRFIYKFLEHIELRSHRLIAKRILVSFPACFVFPNFCNTCSSARSMSGRDAAVICAYCAEGNTTFERSWGVIPDWASKTFSPFEWPPSICTSIKISSDCYSFFWTFCHIDLKCCDSVGPSSSDDTWQSSLVRVGRREPNLKHVKRSVSRPCRRWKHGHVHCLGFLLTQKCCVNLV